MKPKGEDCYSVTKQEFLAHLRDGSVLWCGKYGAYYYWLGRECHPRRDVVRRMIVSGALRTSHHANATQRDAGMATYVLAKEQGQ